MQNWDLEDLRHLPDRLARLQDLPSPTYGWWHEQVKDPTVLVHKAKSWQSCSLLAHSSTSVDINWQVDTDNKWERNSKRLAGFSYLLWIRRMINWPRDVKTCLMKDQIWLVIEHLWCKYVSSLIKPLLPLQVCPSPEKPILQEQLYDPRVFLQSAFSLQIRMEVVHSSASVKEWKKLI